MKRVTAIYLGFFCGSFGIFTAAWTMIFIVRGEYLNAVVALGVSTFCFGCLIPLVTVLSGHVAPRLHIDDRGTTFWPDRSVEMPIHIALLGGVTACAVYTIFAPAGMVTIPAPHAMRYTIPFLSGVLMLIGVPMLWRYFRRGSTTCLRLTPSGFELEESQRTESGSWDQIKDVADRVPGKQTSTSGPIVFVMADDSTPTIAASGMTPEGKALRELVRFYWEHPASRNELTDDRAVERLARSLTQE